MPEYSKYDQERRRQDRERLLNEYREYVQYNSPPVMADLKARIKPLLDFSYASLPELLNIVNAQIFPMRVIIKSDEGPIAYRGQDILDDLRLIDTRDNQETLRNSSSGNHVTQDFHAPVGAVIGVNGGSLASRQTVQRPQRPSKKRPWWENPLFLALLGVPSTLLAAYLVYRFGWTG